VKPEEDLMELQGDHREKVKQLLAGIGFRIKERR
jgi:translation initiation factor 1 (eIF-1/SUI1)